MQMYQLPLMFFPFLVELFLFCSAFYTIKMKAFEVSEFAYFIIFFRDFVIVSYASDSIKSVQQDEFQEGSNLHQAYLFAGVPLN